MQPVSIQARSVRHTSELRACALSVIPSALSVIPAPLSVIPAPSPSFPRPLRHSRTPSVIPAPSPSFLRPLRHSRAPLRHSCALSVIPSALSVIPAPPSVIPAQAGIQASWVGSRTVPMLDGLPQVRAPARAAWWPVGGMEASGGPAVGASEQARCSRCPCRRDRFDTLRGCAHAPSPSSRPPSPSFPRPPPSFLRPLRHSCAPSVIPAQAGIQASWVGSRTAPMLDGLRQVRAPARAAWWPVGGMEASGRPAWSLGFLPAQE